MPIKFTKCKTSLDHDTSNHAVAVMQTCIDPNREFDISNPRNPDGYFGWPKTYWEEDIGTVLLTSVDDCALDMDTIEAFSSFCNHVVTLIDCTEERPDRLDKPLSVEQVMSGITPQKWKSFLAKWKADKAAALKAQNKNSDGGIEEVIKGLAGVHVDGNHGTGDALNSVEL